MLERIAWRCYIHTLISDRLGAGILILIGILRRLARDPLVGVARVMNEVPELELASLYLYYADAEYCELKI